MTEEVERAQEAFEAWVRERHGLEPGDVVRRPELDGGGFFGFTAVGKDDYLRGLAAPDRVLTYAEPEAFEAWLAAVDFAHADSADPVQFVHVYRSLQAPPESRYAEDSFPLLYEQQLATAPVGQVAEPVELPRLHTDANGRRVDVWFQSEPGSQLERWTFKVAADNAVEVERRSGAI